MRIELPSQQADGTPNWVELRGADDLLAADLFAIHAAVRISSGSAGETTYSPREMEDDQMNALLGKIITGWSFGPIPSQVNMAAADVVIGRAMKAKDYVALRKAARPILDELEGLASDTEDPKAGPLPS